MIIHPHIPKRKPRKPTAAQRQLASDWEALVKKYEPQKQIRPTTMRSSPKPYVRDTGPRIPSLSSTGPAVAAAKPSMQYTGTKMIGIGTLHKSNAVPVFSDEEAKDMARMRRG
jgi:hypothetical protein